MKLAGNIDGTSETAKNGSETRRVSGQVSQLSGQETPSGKFLLSPMQIRRRMDSREETHRRWKLGGKFSEILFRRGGTVERSRDEGLHFAPRRCVGWLTVFNPLPVAPLTFCILNGDLRPCAR